MNHAERRIRYFIEMWGSDTKSKICDRSSNSPFVQTKIIEVLKRYWPKNDENHLIIISLFKQKHLTLRSILPLVYGLLFIEGTSLSNYFSIHEHLGGKGIWLSILVQEPDQAYQLGNLTEHMYQLGNLTKHLSWATWLGFLVFVVPFRNGTVVCTSIYQPVIIINIILFFHQHEH